MINPLLTSALTAYYDPQRAIRFTIYGKTHDRQLMYLNYKWTARLIKSLPPQSMAGSIIDYSRVAFFEAGNLLLVRQYCNTIAATQGRYYRVAIIAQTMEQVQMAKMALHVANIPKRTGVFSSLEAALDFVQVKRVAAVS